MCGNCFHTTRLVLKLRSPLRERRRKLSTLKHVNSEKQQFSNSQSFFLSAILGQLNTQGIQVLVQTICTCLRVCLYFFGHTLWHVGY